MESKETRKEVRGLRRMVSPTKLGNNEDEFLGKLVDLFILEPKGHKFCGGKNKRKLKRVSFSLLRIILLLLYDSIIKVKMCWKNVYR